METRVERGQSSVDRFTGAIERQTSQAPSSLFLGLALGSMAAFSNFKAQRQRRLGTVRGPMGRSLSHRGKLQQNGEAGWFRLESFCC